MELREVVKEFEKAGGRVNLRYGRYPGSAYSDVLDAHVYLGSICVSVTTEKLGLGSRVTEEHEHAIARMLGPIVGFAQNVSAFSVQKVREYSTPANRREVVARLKRAGAADVRYAEYSARHREGVWLEALIEILDAQYRMSTDTHGEAPGLEHALVLDWHMDAFAAWFDGQVDTRPPLVISDPS